MSVKSTLKGLQSSEMMKCEACGSYHPIEDCEVVIIKVIKGKNCEMIVPIPEKVSSVVMERLAEEVKKAEVVNVLPEKVVVTQAPQPVRENGIKQRTIVPPGLNAMMMPPSHPQFEAKGAKEYRTA